MCTPAITGTAGRWEMVRELHATASAKTSRFKINSTIPPRVLKAIQA
ncbi:hypothetical protein HMPREF0580_0320 [Mobiluncus mulieris ATCC 35239]|uniref:Uncharacterized protein n=1 Tax=Mobiluncus mulieris ATCC 35239 TaxID=871571 RepID=E0QN56_9ACTO|nr:hypothetical protein HMPREF0577_1954 [Mobiluncus mulieris ATCC 35243]EFM47008.1 hypothetical protein HMPREF0580_0320 [Mobiluncus mulieris ATCC 35239]